MLSNTANSEKTFAAPAASCLTTNGYGTAHGRRRIDYSLAPSQKKEQYPTDTSRHAAVHSVGRVYKPARKETQNKDKPVTADNADYRR
jgi:hypothetical protein